MNLFGKALIVGIPTLLMCLYIEYEERKNKIKSEPRGGVSHPHVEVFRDTVDGQEAIRIRGGYDDVMDMLNGRSPEEPPALPDDLNVDKLPRYHGGCPGCGARSLLGEGLWRYRVLSKTRERWDNTTTYLSRCKKCQTLMKSTVDHND